MIEQPPKLFYGDKNAPKYLSHLRVWPNEKFDGYIPRYFDENYENGRALIRQIKGDCSHCEILPVADLFMRDGDVRALDGRDVLYIDDDHLSQQGALKARTRIKQALERHF